MNAVRKLWFAVVVLLMAAVAWPASAAGPQKSYNAEFLLPAFDTLLNQSNPLYDQTSGQLKPPVAVTLALKNESPPSTANSNISSAQFQVVGLSLLGGSGNITCPNAQCTVDVNTGTVFVTNISPPVQAQQTLYVTMHASSCVALNDAFIRNVTVYTGSQLNGQTFVPFSGPPDPVFPMQLTLSDPTTIQPTAISCGPSNCGDSNLQTQNSLCTGAPGTETNCVASFRSIDKNGACAGSVSYFVTNMLQQSSLMHFVWQIDPAAVFAYQASVKPASGTQPVWQVSWLPTSGTPVFVDAPPCNGADTTDWPLTTSTQFPFPAAYGTLAAAVGANDKKITVTVTAQSVPTPNFPIVIGGERMTVTKITTNSWTVTRGVGGTSSAPHGLNANVMSTPLPLLSGTLSPAQQAAGYFVGLQAQQCQASLSRDNGDGTFSTWIIDIGDAWTGIR